MTPTSTIQQIIESCYLPKLERNYEEREIHQEFIEWEIYLSKYFPRLISALDGLNVMEPSLQSSILASILLLYYQLTSKGKWNRKECDQYARKLDYQLELLCEITCTNLLKTKKVENPQQVFDKSIEILHHKFSPDEFKKYPALIEAYCSIIKDVKEYDVILKPASVLPVSVLLIEDYVNENRVKGLKACSSILKSLTSEHFKEGNYYEVIYMVLKKTVLQRDLEVTKLVLECLYDLLHILSSETQVSTVDDALEVILEQMYTETNLYRKQSFFTFLNNIIHIHGVHCAKRTMFLSVISDNLDICSNSSVGEILLYEVLECLENWIKYCWCVWKLAPNKKIVSSMIKLLYVYKDNDAAQRIENIFLTLCKLCSEDEQKVIHSNIEKSIQDLKMLNESFAQKLESIKGSIS